MQVVVHLDLLQVRSEDLFALILVVGVGLFCTDGHTRVMQYVVYFIMYKYFIYILLCSCTIYYY